MIVPTIVVELTLAPVSKAYVPPALDPVPVNAPGVALEPLTIIVAPLGTLVQLNVCHTANDPALQVVAVNVLTLPVNVN